VSQGKLDNGPMHVVHLRRLDDAVAHNVAARVAEHVAQSSVLGHMPGRLAYDQTALGFVVQLLVLVGVDNGVAWVGYGCGRLGSVQAVPPLLKTTNSLGFAQK
jgi:hypothetical protein